eukprot:Nk52_evm24s1992 gene=Nk52_evmTU24s1992
MFGNMCDEKHLVELKGIGTDCSFSNAAEERVQGLSATDECHFVTTALGNCRVYVQGDKSKKALLTFHDIGTTFETCFTGFFGFPLTSQLLDLYCVYNICAPGHHPLGADIHKGESYSQTTEVYASFTLWDLASVVTDVTEYFNLTRVLLFGVGAGADVLLRYAIKNDKKVRGIILIGGDPCRACYSEWGYFKGGILQMKALGVNELAVNQFMFRFLGSYCIENNIDIANSCKADIKSTLSNSVSSACNYVEAEIARDDISNELSSLSCRMLLLAGAQSPFYQASLKIKTQLKPEQVSWIKVSEAGMFVHEEQPAKAFTAIKLFLESVAGDSTEVHALRKMRAS